MGTYEHTMPGYNQAREFLLHSGYRDDYLNRLESHELIYVANKLHSHASDCRIDVAIPYSMEGCNEARNFLLKTGYSADYVDRLEGHELIFMANQINSEPSKNLQKQ